MRRRLRKGNRIRRHLGGLRGHRVAVVAGAMLFVACAGEPATVPVLPSRIDGAIPTSAVEEIGLQELAAEAIDVQLLAGLLESAGFRAAAGRTYRGSASEIRRVEVRIARFDSASGAERYLEWLRQHVSDVIGDAELAAEHPFRDAPVYVHQPSGCCAKEQVVALGVWRRATDVIRVLIAGPGADGQAASTMFHTLAASFPPNP